MFPWAGAWHLLIRPNPMTEQDCARSEGLLAQMLALHPTEIDLSLDRMHGFLQAMGAPHEHLKNVLHIAGTNGKGSTQAYLKAGLRAAGRSVAAIHRRIWSSFTSVLSCLTGPSKSLFFVMC